MSTTDMVENPLQGGSRGRDKLSMGMKALHRKSKESIRKKRNISRVFQNNMWEFREGIVFKKELEEFKGHSVTT